MRVVRRWKGKKSDTTSKVLYKSKRREAKKYKQSELMWRADCVSPCRRETANATTDI